MSGLIPLFLHQSCGKMWWMSTFSPKKTLWSNFCPERKSCAPSFISRAFTPL